MFPNLCGQQISYRTKQSSQKEKSSNQQIIPNPPLNKSASGPEQFSEGEVKGVKELLKKC